MEAAVLLVLAKVQEKVQQHLALNAFKPAAYAILRGTFQVESEHERQAALDFVLAQSRKSSKISSPGVHLAEQNSYVQQWKSQYHSTFSLLGVYEAWLREAARDAPDAVRAAVLESWLQASETNFSANAVAILKASVIALPHQDACAVEYIGKIRRALIERSRELGPLACLSLLDCIFHCNSSHNLHPTPPDVTTTKPAFKPVNTLDLLQHLRQSYGPSQQQQQQQRQASNTNGNHIESRAVTTPPVTDSSRLKTVSPSPDLRRLSLKSQQHTLSGEISPEKKFAKRLESDDVRSEASYCDSETTYHDATDQLPTEHYSHSNAMSDDEMMSATEDPADSSHDLKDLTESETQLDLNATITDLAKVTRDTQASLQQQQQLEQRQPKQQQSNYLHQYPPPAHEAEVISYLDAILHEPINQTDTTSTQSESTLLLSNGSTVQIDDLAQPVPSNTSDSVKATPLPTPDIVSDNLLTVNAKDDSLAATPTPTAQPSVVQITVEEAPTTASENREDHKQAITTMSREQADQVEQTAPSQLPSQLPAPIHKLSSGWTLWSLNDSAGATSDYDSMIKEVASFDTVESFWASLGQVPTADFPKNNTFYLMRHHLRPKRELAELKDGGFFKFGVDNAGYLRFWGHLLLAVVGETITRHVPKDPILGLTWSRKGDREVRFQIWTSFHWLERETEDCLKDWMRAFQLPIPKLVFTKNI